MIQDKVHRIYKCQVLTSIDDQAKGVGLQNKVSHIMNYSINNMVANILDQLCPQDQQWKIDALHLDLGQIHYDSFNEDFEKHLADKLVEAIQGLLEQSNGQTELINIVESVNSSLAQAQFYLINGFFQWKEGQSPSSFVEIIQRLLDENKKELVALLTVLGKQEKVRRRMAWQISEPTIFKVIEAIEPENYQQIIQFKDHLVLIEKRETNLDRNLNDFKCNVWYWILTYLLTEKGTKFNKKVFIQRTLFHVAHQYKVQYMELLGLFVKAIDELSKTQIVKTETLLIIQELFDEQKSQTLKKSVASEAHDFWKVLETFVKDGGASMSKESINQFNVIIHRLAKEDAKRLKILLLNLKGNQSALKNLVKYSDATVRILLIEVLVPTKRKLVLETIKALEKNGSAQLIWEASLSVLVERSSGTASDQVLLESLVHSLSEKSGLREDQLGKMLQSKHWNKAKNAFSITLFKALSEAYFGNSNKNNTGRNELVGLIKALLSPDKKGWIDPKVKYNKQIRFHYFCKHQPDQVIEILQTRFKLNQLLPRISRIFDFSMLITLIEAQRSNLREPILEWFDQVTKSSMRASLAHEVNEVMFTELIFKLWFENPKASDQFIVNHLIEYFAVGQDQLTLLEWLKTAEDPLLKKALRKALETVVAQAEDKKSKYLVFDNLSEDQIVELLVQAIRSKSSLLKFGDQHIQFDAALQFTLTEFPHLLKVVLSALSEKELKEVQERFSRSYAYKDFSASINKVSFSQKNKSVVLYDELYKVMKTQLGNMPFTRQLDQLFWKQTMHVLRNDVNVKDAVNQLMQLVFDTLHGVPNIKLSKIHDLLNAVSDYLPSALRAELSMKDWAKNLGFENEHSFELKGGIYMSAIEFKKALIDGFEQLNTKIHIDNISFEFDYIIKFALESDSALVKSVLVEKSGSKNYINALRRNVSFEEFTVYIASDRNNSMNEALRSALHFFNALKALIKIQTFIAYFETELWQRALLLIQGKSEPTVWLQSLVTWGIEKSFIEAGVEIQELTDYFKTKESKVSFALKEALTKSSSIFKRTLPLHQIKNVQQQEFKEYTDKYIIELIRELLVHNRIPYWFQGSANYSAAELLRVLLQQRLMLVRKVVRYADLMSPQIGRIRGAMTLFEFIEILKATHSNQRHDLVRLEQLLKSFSRSAFQSFSRAQIEEVCYHILLKTWMFQEWKSITTSDIWNQIMWGMSYFQNVKNDDLIADLKKSEKHYPSSFQNSLESSILSFEDEAPLEDLYEKEQQEKMETTRVMTDQIPVNNAGLVLFNSYIPMLFERLGLTKENEFIGPREQMKAVHYLQYLVTGLSNMDEMYLTLNKVLCGMHPTVPLTATIEITDEEKQLMDSLVQALIKSWTAIGDSDVNGFRGNWLVRDGILTDTEMSWVLTIDSKVYDILLSKTPFSYSMLKFPWTRKPIRVEWEY